MKTNVEEPKHQHKGRKGRREKLDQRLLYANKHVSRKCNWSTKTKRVFKKKKKKERKKEGEKKSRKETMEDRDS